MQYIKQIMLLVILTISWKCQAEEVKEILTSKFAEVLATKNKGMIMKTVMGELKGKADGKVINQVVGELCK